MVGANSIEEQDTRPLLQVKATYMRAICLPFSVSPKDGIGPINERCDAFAPRILIEKEMKGGHCQHLSFNNYLLW